MQHYSDIQLERFPDGASTAAWWQANADGTRIDCLLCPRKCSLKPGDRGFCFVRENRGGQMALTTYGRSTGFCIDPIEKKPLNHFYPGTPVLSFGTAGCNLGCKFCQNWDISKSREIERLSAVAEPTAIADAAADRGCTSVAYTYNDPVIWAEYAIDTAKACREQGIHNVAVTAGYITSEARGEFFEYMDAANVDLKAFTEDFYNKVTYSHLQPVLDTLVYLKQETDVWFELTNLMIPGENDNPDDLRKMCDWILNAIGNQVPIHFTAFHPDFRMMDTGRTPSETLFMAQELAKSAGLHYAYVGNVHDSRRQNTYCHQCGHLLVERNWYELGKYDIRGDGTCGNCGIRIPGRFAEHRGNWGSRRQPIRMDAYASEQDLPQTHQIQVSKQSTEESPLSTTPTSQADDSMAATKPSKPGLLNVDRLDKSQRSLITKTAADLVVAAVFDRSPETSLASLGGLGDSIVMGAFVTLKRGVVLRGCCGALGKPMSLKDALKASAAKTAREDQRMAPISPCELPYLTIDVTLLGPFQRITAQGTDRKDSVEIGRHGLMIQRNGRNGLLLPSVATERKWDAVQFLQAVCNKAGLPIGSWESSDATVFTFDGRALGGALSDYLPEDLPPSKPLPLTQDQVAEYAKIAGENVAALVSGGTPTYVITQLPDVNVNAIVVSMRWEPDHEDEKARQGNLLQVSFRPGVALQSTLYQMCQQAAQMFQQQRFSGQMQIGLTLGFDPAMHGYSRLADLEGLEDANRALVISDGRHCGLAFHPDQSPDEIREKLREILPISARDASVHSLQYVSTMPHLLSISAPSPVPASGIRPAAVAGKFYPAQDAARRALIGTLFKEDEPARSSPLAIMVPHAGIKYSGKIAARVWRSLEQPAARTMIIISPKHTPKGVNWAVCPFDSWQLSGTTNIGGDPELARQIAEAVTPVHLDAAAHQQEHGIEVQLPILERLDPACKVVGLALNGGSWDDIQAAAVEFAEFLKTLPEMPLLVISSDMNHFAPDAENRRRDRLALDAMSTGDPQQLLEACRTHEISMCGQVPAAFVMETLRQLELDFKVVEVGYGTSADVSGDKTQVVGYAGALLQPA